MVTRLRSARGSFVRSPKGAFDTDDIPSIIINGRIVTFDLDIPTSTSLVGFGCSPLEDLSAAPLGYILNVFQLFAVAPDMETLLAGTFTGQSSGATFSPNTDFAPLRFECGTDALTNKIYAKKDPPPGNIFPAGPAYEAHCYLPSQFFFQTYSNYGQFPGAARPVGFIEGEDVVFQS